jgi:8-hydroxy-5-deazaflavin:NADPH oxidoreductase
MRIGIIGAGNVGAAVGTRWAAAGHEVTFGVRDPGAAKVTALVAGAAPRARAASVAQAASWAEVVVLATPFDAAEAALREARDLSGKIVVDCTNPLTRDVSALTIGHTTSAGEAIASMARGARVVKALNTTGAGNMIDPRYGAAAATMFVCGDDAAAKATVTELVTTLGFDVVDAGPLRQARLLEPLAMLWISLAYARGLGPNIAFRLMRR